MDRDPRSRPLPPGAPLVLPAWLDRLAERWWAASPRVRRGIALSTVALVVVAGTIHVGAGPYGPPQRVLVATRELGVGETLSTGVLERRDWPRSLVPDGALTDPAGVLRAPLPRGAVATTLHVAEDGVASELPEGQVAVAVAAELLPGIDLGTRVALLATRADGSSVMVADDAWVLRVDERTAWIALAEADAPDATLAAATGALSVIVRPG